LNLCKRIQRQNLFMGVDNLFALKVDTITLNNNIIRQLWDYDFQLCQQLANCLGVNVRDHPSKHTGYGVLAMK